MGAYFRESGDRLQCLVCPHLCRIAEGKTGICGVRKNNGREIELITYGVISGYSLDPVEKKPLYHFYPGYNILSVGSYGCNMRCDFCQNYSISQNVHLSSGRKMQPTDLLDAAFSANRNIGLAFTYNEPTIWFEFIMDTAALVRSSGLKTVLVSNGYVNPDPLRDLITVIDAFNIDLKAFNASFHKKLTGADLEPVKESLKLIANSGKHLEITSLIIPGQNDNEADMTNQAEWIAGELGKSVPLHLSRYFPMYKRDDPPTSETTLTRLYETALRKLDYVYLGNTGSESGQTTVCPGCGNKVTSRSGYSTRIQNIDKDGKCSVCGTLIYSNLIFPLPKKGH